MAVLADTNILLRLDATRACVARRRGGWLLDDGEDVHFTPQNIAEFWNVATRPIANNGFGLDASAARQEVEIIEQILTLLPDTPAIYDEWKRLVASMNVHGVDTLLTFNTDDFLRYTRDTIHPIRVVHPSSVP